MTEADLSVVVPVYNEVAVVEELVRRCQAAAAQTGDSWELIVVDDFSSDGTAERLVALADGTRTHHLRLPENLGQFRATCAGLRVTRGRLVVVLDGDLQDPPECIPLLVSQLADVGETRAAAFAVKTARGESPVFLAGRWLYGVLSSIAVWRLPAGSGAYCAMSGDLARRIPGVPSNHANLAPFVAAVSDRLFIVPYEKAARYDGASRVGLIGLALEALATLQYNGSFERIALVVSAALVVSQIWGGALVVAGVALALRRRRLALERRLRGSETSS